tara:strand:+ start:74 stop:181 length:108 start_codon:yes stop_codon:yes gene_type:complete
MFLSLRGVGVAAAASRWTYHKGAAMRFVGAQAFLR